MGIEDLNKAIQQYKIKNDARKKQEEKEKKIELKKEREYKEKEKQLLGKKAKIYTKILAWRDKFIKTEQFKELFSESDSLSKKDIKIYCGGWGHRQPNYGGYGCWSRIYLEKSGKLRYFAGYKWMAPGLGLILDKNTFQKLSYDYLNKLQKDIESGRVYETISRDIKERL